MKKNTTNITIIGQYITKFGELWDRSLEDLFAEAVAGCLDSSGFAKSVKNVGNGGKTAELESKIPKIDAIFVANMAAGQFSNQLHLSALVSQLLPHNPPAFRVEAACASGGLALEMAQLALLSGKYETVLVVGAEKMTDATAQQATKILSAASWYETEYGSTFPALYAMIARAHIKEFGTTRAHLSAVAVKNHRHATANSKAQFQKEVCAEMVEKSTLVADPIRLLDCSAISDGAAAVLLTTKNSDAYKNKPKIEAVGHAQDSLDLAHRKSLVELLATKKAAHSAYKQAGITAADISVAEVHDCFTIAEILACEDLGFFEKGSAASVIASGETARATSQKIIVNPSGGLKGCGHPVGATGVKQVAFLAEFLQEKFRHSQSQLQSSSRSKSQSASQEKSKKHHKKIYALAHNVGGSGATAIVHILSQNIE